MNDSNWSGAGLGKCQSGSRCDNSFLLLCAWGFRWTQTWKSFQLPLTIILGNTFLFATYWCIRIRIGSWILRELGALHDALNKQSPVDIPLGWYFVQPNGFRTIVEIPHIWLVSCYSWCNTTQNTIVRACIIMVCNAMIQLYSTIVVFWFAGSMCNIDTMDTIWWRRQILSLWFKLFIKLRTVSSW